MKKVFTSALMIFGTVSAVALGTRAFFSDTEISATNTFQAGAVDLKVDSQAKYNGMECINNVWQTCTNQGSNLVLNGGFEIPEVPNNSTIAYYQDGTVPNWKIDWITPQPDLDEFGNVRPAIGILEYQRQDLGWLPFEGNQLAELDTDWSNPSITEPALVKIAQTVTGLTVGQQYTPSYAFSPRPGTPLTENVLTVKAGGTEQTHTLDGTGLTQTSWQQFSQHFIATSTSTTIEFLAGGTPNSVGIFIDAIQLRGRSCQPNPDYEGLTCNSTWALTNLGPQSQFSNFADVKPGDTGQNAISLHVTNNDAYACMFIRDAENNDPNLTEPEASDGDSTIGDGNGEIAQQLRFFAWMDDGDNIWEPGEIPLQAFVGGPITASSWLSIGQSFPLFTPSFNGIFGTDETKYVGMAWCAGTMSVNFGTQQISCDGSVMNNLSQTDEFTASIGFYIEQSRNNQQFTCPASLLDSEQEDEIPSVEINL